MFKGLVAVCTQCVCLFVLILLPALILPEMIDVYDLFYLTVFAIIYLPLFYQLLKWMGKYRIGYWRMYFINGLLVTGSCVIIWRIIDWVTGRTVYNYYPEGIVIILAGAVPSAFFWWNFDVINFIRRRSMRKAAKKQLTMQEMDKGEAQHEN